MFNASQRLWNAQEGAVTGGGAIKCSRQNTVKQKEKRREQAGSTWTSLKQVETSIK